MNSLALLQAGKIKNLSTKFFYKGNQLCYQIMVSYDNRLLLYKNFEDYQAYKEMHDHLIDALNNRSYIRNDFQNVSA
jgi:predicted DNA-binding protein YlxM (UPF0122 family)